MRGAGKKILVIGSGPIVIGQACEFDYSGTQACRALKDEGAEVVLVNSNPATIMTDPSVADRTYIEPLTPATLEDIIAREKPDAVLPTVGGQTAINLAVALARSGALERHGVQLIGAQLDAIELAEDRKRFAEAMEEIGIGSPRNTIVQGTGVDGVPFDRAADDAAIERALQEVGVPAIVRPSYTLGGTGGGMAYDEDGFRAAVRRGMEASPANQVLVEQSVEGWKEYELEVMRDMRDNVVIICSIENLDPMGVHTGDSITVAPALTLTDREYQTMRDAALKIIRRVGVETGGSNIQFAVNPKNGELIVIEMNPRVSRSSALASKATGFPIAKIAARLALGYSLDQIPNDITQTTPSCFEPVLDYVVVKIPRFDFAKFPESSSTLGPQMKSVGEVMAIGRTFREAFRKGVASMETPVPGFLDDGFADVDDERLRRPSPDRVFAIFQAIRAGRTAEEVHALTGVDPWFLHQFVVMAEQERRAKACPDRPLPAGLLTELKRDGVGDETLATWLSAANAEGSAAHGAVDEAAVRGWRRAIDLRPSYLRVDTCAGEFASQTPYLYSAWESRDEAPRTERDKVVILGSGPNRIGQGIEFDYCCCHAAFALQDRGIETIMVNCNPETVSTDYDTADRLYFEPLDLEHVLSILDKEQPRGVIVQLGGQTPLKLANALADAGVPILGTSPDTIDLAEDRGRFGALLQELGIRQPNAGMARSAEEALQVADRVGYPVLVRPSYVLGGRAMRIVYEPEGLRTYLTEAVTASEHRPVLIDQFLEDAFEFDVDALCDGRDVVIAGIMQHIEEAGVHSGDSSAIYPPVKQDPAVLDELRDITRRLGTAMGVRGLMNVQFAVRDGSIYVLEVNPRASRTVPFLAKATGIPLVQHATGLMLGETLADVGMTAEPVPKHVYAKAPVFPFRKFEGVDVLLGPEMRSTGEVMGVGSDAGEAFYKAMLGAGLDVRVDGPRTVFISVHDRDKEAALSVARKLVALGYRVIGTRGTALYLFDRGLPAQLIYKVNEGHPHIVDLIEQGDVQLVINTPLGRDSYFDEKAIRVAANKHGVPCITTLSAATAALQALEHVQDHGLDRFTMQDWIQQAADARPSR